MSANNIFQCLEELIQIHTRLYELAKEKTERIKKNDIPALERQLKQEEKEIFALQTQEKKRVRLTQAFIREKGKFIAAPTTSDLQPFLDENENEQLAILQEKLLNILQQLQEQNQLNAELIQNSLQFVNLSLSLVERDTSNVGYGRKNSSTKHHSSAAQKRSLFDSKA